MRVIAGTYRSRPLVAPRGQGTRPTSDRLRETLFNILASRISGASFADLYAGTGAVGIEALSRGASHVLFAEHAAPAVSVLRTNLQTLGITAGFTLEARSALSALDRVLDRIHSQVLNAAHEPGNRIKSPPPVFDIVFLDPPYEAVSEYTSALALLGSTRSRPLLARDALIVAEHSSKSPLPESFGTLQQTRVLKQGDAALTFYSQRDC